MGFEKGNRRGSYWDDAKKIDQFIQDFPFHTTGRTEKDFENGFSLAMMTKQKEFNNEVITQVDKTKKVKSVHCFGKKNRPDLTFSEDGIAFEIKLITYGGLSEAIGQGFLYRLNYKFAFIILVISEYQDKEKTNSNRDLYYDISDGKEKDLEDILTYLSEEMNIFTYIVPAFDIKKTGKKKCIAFFK